VESDRFGCRLPFGQVTVLPAVEFYRFTGGFGPLVTVFTGGQVAVRSYSSSGDVFSSESVQRLSPVAIFREFIGDTNAHLNRDL